MVIIENHLVPMKGEDVMDYKEAINYIENTGKFGINLGLKRIERLCQLLGNPEKNLKVIHVAGTNGKGSTTTLISSVLISQGYKVGIYTSPYIERFTERIKINDIEIPEDEVAKLVNEMLPYIDILVEEGLEHPTEFEIITAAGFKYFSDQRVDFVVLEVGLGGRFDATNVVNPILSVITTISYDHMNILGNSIDEIAFEKAGIIKDNVPVVVYPQEKAAMDVIIKVSDEKKAKLHFVENMQYELVIDTEDGIIFNATGDNKYKNLKIRLLGEHQILNSMTALKSIEVMKQLGYIIDEKSIYTGFENAKWPGRFEIINPYPHIVLDGGHNIQGVKALVCATQKYFNGKKIKVVCGMLRDKNYKDMIRELTYISDEFITVTPNNPRALTAVELKEVIEEMGKSAIATSTISEAVNIGMKDTNNDEVLLFCGSLYMIGEARTIIKGIVNIE